MIILKASDVWYNFSFVMDIILASAKSIVTIFVATTTTKKKELLCRITIEEQSSHMYSL